MWDSRRDTDVQNSLLDSVGEGEGGMIWENGTETRIISYMKQIPSPGSMHDTEWISLNYGAGPLECFLQRGEKQRISQHGYIKMNWYICFFFGSWILKWNKGDTCLNVPIQVLLCSERHLYLRDYVSCSSAIKLIVRTQKHPNLVPQITMFPRGPPGGTVGVLSSWEVSYCSSLGKNDSG